MFKSKTFNIIFSIVLATLLWAYVMININPQATKEFKGIEIEYINANSLSLNNLAVVENENITADIVLEGNINVLNSLTADDISATIDLAGREKGENTIPVSLQLPDGVKIASVSPETVSVVIEEKVEEIYTIDLQIDGSLPSGYKIISSTFTPETVIATGPKSAMDQVENVVAKVNPNDIAISSDSIPATLVAVNKEGVEVPGVTLSEKTSLVRLEYSVDDESNQTTQTFFFDADDIIINNLNESLTADLGYQSIRVTIKGDTDVMSELEKSDISLSVNLSNLTAGAHSVDVRAIVNNTTEITIDPSVIDIEINEK